MMLDATQDNPKIRYNACTTQDGGKRSFNWHSYKTYRGARNRVRRLTGYGSRADGWFIERVKEWTDADGKYRASCVIIAQAKNTICKNHYRTIA